MHPFWYLPLENGILHNTVFYVMRITNIGFIHLGSQVTIPGSIDQPSLATCDDPTAGPILLQKWHRCSCKSFEYSTITITTQMGLVYRKLLRQYKQTALYECSWKKTPNLQHGRCILSCLSPDFLVSLISCHPQLLPFPNSATSDLVQPLTFLCQLQALCTTHLFPACLTWIFGTLSHRNEFCLHLSSVHRIIWMMSLSLVFSCSQQSGHT